MTAPVWLRAFQSEFSQALTRPLAVQHGTFHVNQDDCAALLQSIVSSAAAERLALYQRQYWTRLFNALQARFPRFATNIGHFRFNQLAQLHLLNAAPREVDIARSGDGFVEAYFAFAREQLSKSEHAPLLSAIHCVSPAVFALSALKAAPDQWANVLPLTAEELLRAGHALQMDEALYSCFHSPLAARWTPTLEELPLLQTHVLRFAPDVKVVTDAAGLMNLGQGAAGAQQESHALPRKPSVTTSSVRFWVLQRSIHSVQSYEVAREFARLLELARSQPLKEALLSLEAELDAGQRETLAHAVQGWVQDALARRLWTGLAPAHRE